MRSRSPHTSPAVPRRRYNSTRRALQAAQTRHDVLVAATELFRDAGWAGTTVSDVAARAGVAVETIYSGFGSKKGLLHAAMDVAIVGDAEPIPFVERDEFQQLARGSVTERLQFGVAVVTAIHQRSAGIWRAIMEAAVADPEVDGWRVELEQGRRSVVERSFTVVVGRDLDRRTLDLLWVLLGPEVYLKLTVDAGLTPADYQSHLLDAVQRLTARPRSGQRPQA